jgi:hypothetical protein
MEKIHLFSPQQAKRQEGRLDTGLVSCDTKSQRNPAVRTAKKPSDAPRYQNYGLLQQSAKAKAHASAAASHHLASPYDANRENIEQWSQGPSQFLLNVPEPIAVDEPNGDYQRIQSQKYDGDVYSLMQQRAGPEGDGHMYSGLSLGHIIRNKPQTCQNSSFKKDQKKLNFMNH